MLNESELKPQEIDMLSGQWTYRSFHNRTDLVGDDAGAALALIFGEGVFDLEAVTYTHFRGTADFGGGYKMDLDANIQPGDAGGSVEFDIVGKGIAGSATDGWRYDYKGAFGHRWDNGIEQRPSMVGTVVRTNPHGDAKAGYTASFIAVQHG